MEISKIKVNPSKGPSQIDEEFLDDLASRFIINVPVEERANLIRICFQIELAHWFYLDFFCSNEDERSVPCGIKQFAIHIFHHVPFLRPHMTNLDEILENWKKYKLSVPTYGAILLSEDLKHVLLVQSYWAKSSWGFPKGKVNENEDPAHCAVREVFEETGFDISHLIMPNEYFESIFNYQFSRLYIVCDVPYNTVFTPRTRYEIKCCEWFPIDLLPNSKTDIDCKSKLGINPNSFFMVMPFIKKLKKWVSNRRDGLTATPGFLDSSSKRNGGGNRSDSKNKRQRHKSMGDLESLWPTINSYDGGLSSNSKAITVAKCQSQMNKFTPIAAEQGKRREKSNKLSIKRQLFGPADSTSEPSQGALQFVKNNAKSENSNTGTKSKPQKTQNAIAELEYKEAENGHAKKQRQRLPITAFLTAPKKWNDFRFDYGKICNIHKLIL